MTLESVLQDRCERCVWGHIAVQASGRSWLLRLSSRRAEVLLRAALYCAEGLRALLPWLTKRRPVCCQRHRGHCSRGVGTEAQVS